MSDSNYDYEVIDILLQIGETPSRNEKEEILNQYYNFDHLKKILEYVYNPYKVYGVGSKAFAKKYQDGFNCKLFDNIIDLLDYLLINNTGTDETKILINTFIKCQPKYQEMFKRIILKDLKIGITEKTINKVWTDLVPTFNVMLAEPFERMPEHIAVEYKFDGVRATGVKINGQTKLYTRNGKVIEGFDSIIEQLNALPLDDIVFDGELISDNDYKSTMEKVFKKTGNKEADYMIFDLLPLSEFNKGVSTQVYDKRRQLLTNFMLSSKNTISIPNLLLAPVIKILNNPTVEQLDVLTKQAVQDGFEGTMIKDLEGLYYCKRTYDWQKLKPFFDGDFEIIRIEEGKGKNKGRMGKVVIDVNGVEVGLGTGWNDLERIDMWENPNKYIGQIVEVQYQEIIEKSGSLRFPSVKGIRWDK